MTNQIYPIHGGVANGSQADTSPAPDPGATPGAPPAFSDAESDRLINGIDAIGEAMSYLIDEGMCDMVHAAMPATFTDGLGAHVTAWLKNVYMRDAYGPTYPNREYLYQIALVLEMANLIERGPHSRHADIPSWRLK